MILRDRDNFTGGTANPMNAAGDEELEERRYYCQNWRADVVAVTRADGTPWEYVRYSAYGEPTVYPVADVNMDGVVNSNDATDWTSLLSAGTNNAVLAYSDIDFDGADDLASGGIDSTLFYDSYAENTGLSGKGRLSSPGVGNRIGYAGYQWDQTLRADHVRYRVYLPEIGRWTRRDPAGYVDGMGLYEALISNPIAKLDWSGLNCIVRIMYKKIGLGYYHTYILVTDSAGNRFYVRGGPSEEGPSGGAGSSTCGGGSSGGSSQDSGGSPNSTSPGSGDPGIRNPKTDKGPWGPIQTDYGDYGPDTIDWDAEGDDIVQLLNAPGECEDIIACLKKAAERLDRDLVPYSPVGSNSNATANWLLADCGMTAPKPIVWVPGWDTPRPSPTPPPKPPRDWQDPRFRPNPKRPDW